VRLALRPSGKLPPIDARFDAACVRATGSRGCLSYAIAGVIWFNPYLLRLPSAVLLPPSLSRRRRLFSFPRTVVRRDASVCKAGEGCKSGSGSWDVYSLLKRDLCAVRIETLRKSVIAREGARNVGSSSSRSTVRRRYKLVPDRSRREESKRDGRCDCDGVGGSRLDSRRFMMLVRRASIRLIALLGLDRVRASLSGSMLLRIVGDSPLIWRLGRRDTVAADVRWTAGLMKLDLPSYSSIHKSVKLRHYEC
jgi:hypothetical protein